VVEVDVDFVLVVLMLVVDVFLDVVVEEVVLV